MLAVIILALCSTAGYSQPVEDSEERVEVTFNKTTSLVFPVAIESVDRGSADVLVQKAPELENVLQLKASRREFPETNLTVVTAEGRIHHFTVNYADDPGTLVVNTSNLDGNGHAVPTPLIFTSELTGMDLEHYSKWIVNTKRPFTLIGTSKHKVGLALKGIYVQDDILFFRFLLTNKSNITYDVDFLRLYVRDKAQVKRTASQEVVRKPVYVYGNDKTIKGKSAQEVVYALDKFTIPDAKRLVIEMYEADGGRHLALEIKNKTIVKAKPVPGT